MTGDSDLQVWLEQQYATRMFVTPYVKSAREMKLKYRLNVLQIGTAGSSRISQGGTIDVEASKPTALSTVSLSSTQTKECNILLTLNDGEQEIGRYEFDCQP